ncbi:putative PMS1 protein like protein [Halenospora varia]|nr:putative PMS1 protein like protein [Halenospora varia]
MAITALPQATVHLLGSAQALTTPTSLVKELIDNSLDAKATSIDILISQNTLDKIEVRDNGHGIQQEDLESIGKRGHTSKLRSFDELRAVGGVSLGFRGEALASAVQLGELSVTTKTDGEAVATTVKIKPPGKIDSRSRTSHPVGTTVCVLNFMAKLPVRKQTFLKSAPKTLAKVKELLQAYALARPTVRFSLKVSKGAKGAWTFTPRPNDGIKEAVSQVIGRDAALQCMERSLNSPGTQGESCRTDNTSSVASDQSLDKKFQIDAFLPKPDLDLSRIGHGQYVSIDSRPVSHERGTMKKIITMFKYYIKGAFGDASELKNPFILLSIKCPIASYDPNVEPAKDDVLFINEFLVLESVESLFKNVYGEQSPVPQKSAPSLQDKTPDDFNVLLARKPAAPSLGRTNHGPTDVDQRPARQPPISSPSSPAIASISGKEPEESASSPEEVDDVPVADQRKWGFDMSKDFTEEVEDLSKKNRSTQFRVPWVDNNGIFLAQEASKGSLNPWLIAKMTAPIKESVTQHATLSLPMTSEVVPTLDIQATPSPSVQASEPMVFDLNVLDSQRFSNQPGRRYSNESIRPQINHPLENQFDEKQLTPRKRRHSNGSMSLQRGLGINTPLNRLDFYETRGVPVLPTTSNTGIGYENAETLFVEDGDQTFRDRRRNDFISARHMTANSLLSPPATQRSKRSRPNGVNRPFVAPRPITESASPLINLRQSTLSDGFQTGPLRSLEREVPQENTDSELEWAMEFEQRKEDASRQRREQIRMARKEAARQIAEHSNRTSPHKNRYNAAIAALEADSLAQQNVAPAKAPFSTTLLEGDPRAYLMKQQRLADIRSGPLKLTRAKSMKLPLERTPDDIKTHALMLTLSTDMTNLGELEAAITRNDPYVEKGIHTSGLSLEPSAIPALTTRIKEVVGKWLAQDEERKTCEVEYRFENISTGVLGAA